MQLVLRILADVKMNDMVCTSAYIMLFMLQCITAM
jgi:hypothetical protein